MKQTQMYVCRLEEFILVEAFCLLYKLEVISNGNSTGIYTNVTMDEKCEKCFCHIVDRREKSKLHSNEKLTASRYERWEMTSLCLSRNSHI